MPDLADAVANAMMAQVQPIIAVTPNVAPANQALIETKPAGPVARFVNPVIETVPLDFPIEFAGRIYDSIPVNRLMIGTLADFMAGEGSASVKQRVFRFPMFGDTPTEVLDALELSDNAKVKKVADSFLPPDLRSDPKS